MFFSACGTPSSPVSCPIISHTAGDKLGNKQLKTQTPGVPGDILEPVGTVHADHPE